MVDLDFAPPPPPKFLSEKSDKEFKESKDKPIEKELVKEIPAVESEKKEGFFSKVFKKKETETVGKSVEQPIGEAEKKLNLEDVRAKYNIPSKEEKIEKKAVDVKKWDNGDIVEEYQEPTSKSPRWDTPVHKADHIHGEISSEEEIDVSKMPQRKSHRKMGERMTGVKIKGKRRSPVNKAIDDYFKKVEREQLLIQKELERIVTHPKKSLKKKSKEYLIHHNEKLIKSMKQLLATIKTIDDVKFQKSVQGNKKAFQKWISGILELEKKAENKRNQIMQKKIIQMFKVYRDGLNKDLDDKKYSISEQKKNADKQIKQAEDERTNIGTQKEKRKILLT
jgi:hypothetical protein